MTTTEPTIHRDEEGRQITANGHLGDPAEHAHEMCPAWLNLGAIVSDDEIRDLDALAWDLGALVEQAMILGPRVEWARDLEKRIRNSGYEADVEKMFNDVSGVDLIDAMATLVGAFLLLENSASTDAGLIGEAISIAEVVPGAVDYAQRLVARSQGEEASK